MANPNQVGAFIPTTNIWDVSQLATVDVNSKEFKELLIRLYQNVNNIANVLNVKDSGYYPLSEFVNGQLFFPNPALNSASTTTARYRQDLRQVYWFPTLSAAPAAQNHNITITTKTVFTRIYGVASDVTSQTDYFVLPYSSVTSVNDNIQLDVNATQVVITPGSGVDLTGFVGIVVLEYLQS